MNLPKFLSKWQMLGGDSISIDWVSDAGDNAEYEVRVVHVFGVFKDGVIHFDQTTYYGTSLKIVDIDPGEEIRKISVKRSLVRKCTLFILTEC